MQDHGTVSNLIEKKITFVKFVNAFISKIGRFGINYYGFLFDYYVNYLEYTYQTVELNAKNSNLGKKRSIEERDSEMTPQ